MTLVQVRYRDISYEEVRRLHSMFEQPPDKGKRWETEFRGRLVTIQTPAVCPKGECGLPHFDVQGGHLWVCGHLAEIGD